jgi:polysaccharide export outer membrane protein
MLLNRVVSSFRLAWIMLSRQALSLLLIANPPLVASLAAQDVPAGSSVSMSAQARVPSSYHLGPEDVVEFYGVDAEEIVGKPYRIEADGQISLPLVGRLRAAGITLRELEDALNDRLKVFIQQPQLVANVVEFRSQPVSVVGAVNQSGTQQLQGQRTLLDMISLAGGLRQDAGYSVRITRRLEWGPLPLPGAHSDSTGRFSVAEVNLRDLLAARRPSDNIQVLPHDVITVPEAERVFVLGDVGRSGGYLLSDGQSMSVVEVVSMAEGLARTADFRNCRILRVVAEQTARQEIRVDVKAILAGKAEDVPLRAGDILFVPGSVSKTVGLRTAEAVIQAATGLAIWGRR